jgi:iron complex outermembrane recepter protein
MSTGKFGGVLALALVVAGVEAAETQPNADTSEQIAEITVTAQFRSERSQDVPISVSALSGEDLSRQAIATSDQLQVSVPALNWTGSQFGSPYIRGIGAANVLPGSSSDVPIYIDGVLQVSPQQSNFGLYNVEQVTVLKGPQGTLFGRNASAGVINITTRDPKQAPSVDVGIGYGNFGTYDANIFANGGLTRTLSANIAFAYHDQSEGWGHNLTTGADVFRQRWIDTRGKLRWDPTDDTNFTLAAGYTQTWSDMNTARISENHIGLDGTAFPGPYNTRAGQESYFQRQVWSLSLNESTKTGFGEFKSITGYSSIREFWSNDVDGVAPQFLYAWYNIPNFGFTQEFRFVSPNDRPVYWVAGVFYENNRSSWDPLFVTGLDQKNAVVIIRSDLADQQEAAYADITWAFAPDTRLTIGGRYSMDDEQVSGRTAVNGTPGAENYQKKHFQKPTWRAVVDHKFTPDAMVYASATSGFNQGSFNSTNPAAAALEPETVVAYEIGGKTEWLDRRLRLNADVYYENYKNLQTTVVTNLLTEMANVGAVHIKGVELEVQALPMEHLTLQFNYNYNDAKYAEYPNSQCFTQAPNGAGVAFQCSATGNTVRISPKNAVGTSILYDLYTPIGKFQPSITDSYKSVSYFDFGNTIRNPAHNLVNATLNYSPNVGNWRVGLWGRNLTNRVYSTGEGARGEGFLGSPAEPRVFGITFDMHF